MMTEDITFCTYNKCTHRACKRHVSHIKQVWLDHSYAEFRECEFWKEGHKEPLEEFAKYI